MQYSLFTIVGNFVYAIVRRQILGLDFQCTVLPYWYSETL